MSRLNFYLNKLYSFEQYFNVSAYIHNIIQIKHDVNFVCINYISCIFRWGMRGSICSTVIHRSCVLLQTQPSAPMKTRPTKSSPQHNHKSRYLKSGLPLKERHLLMNQSENPLMCIAAVRWKILQWDCMKTDLKMHIFPYLPAITLKFHCIVAAQIRLLKLMFFHIVLTKFIFIYACVWGGLDD